MTSSEDTTVAPLDGVRVVELAGGVSAALCARFLRGFGATTIRVEAVADVGAVGDTLTDDQRVFLVSGATRCRLADADALRRLLDEADVIVEDRGPGFLTGLGFDPAARAERTPSAAADAARAQVITSLSPFGHTGPRAGWRAGNAVQFAVGGLMTLTGDPDREPLVTGGDQAQMFGGLHGFAATVVALLDAARHRVSTWLDLSLQELAASIPELYAPSSEYDLGEPVPRSGNSVRSVWGVYPCADGYAGVCCLERQVKSLFALIGEPVVSDPRFDDPLSRRDNDDELLAYVMGFMAEHTKDELAALSPVHRVPFGAVRTPGELLDDETFAVRCFFDEVVVSDGDRAVMPGRPFPGLGWVAPARLEPVVDGTPPWPATPGPQPAPVAPAGTIDTTRPRALDGVRVLDLTMMWAGPYATKLLAESGADVIKIESPGAWDNIRTLVPQDPEPADPWNSAYYFNEYNHSKRSLTLDLATDEGRRVFLRFVADADVVIENYRADVLDKLGLGYDVLRQANDDIVLVSMAGFGKTGPLADHVGFGPIIEMMSGLMSLTGYGDDGVPYKTGVSYGDPVGGINAVAAVALALLAHDRTGSGRHIDLAQRETAATLAGPAFVAASRRGEEPVHRGNRHPEFAPQGCYRTSGDDAWLVVTVEDDAGWVALASVIGRPELAALSLDERRARHDELDAAIGQWTGGQTADAAARRLQELGVAAGEVLDTLAVHDDPQLVAREFYRVVPNEKMHTYRQSGPTWSTVGPPPHEMRRAPWFGEHNHELLTEQGLSSAEIAALAAAGVIADAPRNPGVG